jgi:hypothetical protein
MACARAHSAGAWTQLVFQTQTWKSLAQRADARDVEAWQHIANLIEWNCDHVSGTRCTKQMVSDVRASASRLSSN